MIPFKGNCWAPGLACCGIGGPDLPLWKGAKSPIILMFRPGVPRANGAAEIKPIEPVWFNGLFPHQIFQSVTPEKMSNLAKLDIFQPVLLFEFGGLHLHHGIACSFFWLASQICRSTSHKLVSIIGRIVASSRVPLADWW